MEEKRESIILKLFPGNDFSITILIAIAIIVLGFVLCSVTSCAQELHRESAEKEETKQEMLRAYQNIEQSNRPQRLTER